MFTKQGMRTRGVYEVRSGKCPKCGTAFDDSENKPRKDKRYCPRCQKYRLGNIKQIGVIGDTK